MFPFNKFFEKIDPRRFAALRFAFGIFSFLFFCEMFAKSRFWYSEEAWLPINHGLEFSVSWSLFNFITKPWAVTVCILLFTLSSVFMTIGLFARLTTFFCFIGIASMHGRNGINLSYADSIIRIILLYLSLAPTGAAWSLDSRRKASPSFLDHVLLSERWVLLLMQIHICYIYCSTGLAKLEGKYWIQGDALDIVLQNIRLRRWDLSFMTTQPIWQKILRVVTWIVLFWEISFPLLMLSKLTRYFALIIGVAVHLGIILLMKVHWFGYIMLASYIIFIPESWFDRIERFCLSQYKKRFT